VAIDDRPVLTFASGSAGPFREPPSNTIETVDGSGEVSGSWV
jgi:hypothetical protein